MDRANCTIAKYLKDNGFLKTLAAFEQEVDLEYKDVYHLKPLLELLEDAQPRQPSAPVECTRIQVELLKTLSDHTSNVLCCTSKNGLIVTGSTDRSIIGYKQDVLFKTKLSSPIVSLHIQDEMIAAGCMNGIVYFLNEKGDILQQLDVSKDPILGILYQKQWIFHTKNQIFFWNESLSSIQLKSCSTVALVKDYLITSHDHYLVYIHLETREQTLYNLNANGDDWISFNVMDIQPSPNQKYLLIYTSSLAGKLLLFDTFSSSCRAVYYGPKVDEYSLPKCCWHPSGGSFFVTSQEEILVMDTRGKVGHILKHDKTVRNLYFVDSTLLSASYDKTVKVWNCCSSLST